MACACFTRNCQSSAVSGMLPVHSVRDVPGPYQPGAHPPPPGFSQVLILKVVKVLCFDTLLQVFILKELTGVAFCIAGSKSEEFWIVKRVNKERAGSGTENS